MKPTHIHGMKWLLMGIALIVFPLPFSSVNIISPGFDFSTILMGFCLFSPFIGLIMCIYGFLKKD